MTHQSVELDGPARAERVDDEGRHHATGVDVRNRREDALVRLATHLPRQGARERKSAKHSLRMWLDPFPLGSFRFPPTL